MKKRFIALLLCCVMIFTLSPSLIASVAADDNTATQSAEGQVTTGETADTTGNNPPVDPQPDANNGGTGTGAENSGSSEEKSGKDPASMTDAELYAHVKQLSTDEEIEAFLKQLPEARVNALIAYAQAQEPTVVPKTVVFTDAGPFMPPVTVERVLRRYAARATAEEPADNGNGLELSKTATANGNGSYTIRMEAYTTGTVTTSTKTVPVDIVLVLDQSGSMAYDFNGNSTNTNTARRQYAMKQAVNKFIDEVAGKYTTDADHRMAIVTFGSGASKLQDWTVVDKTGKGTLQGKINGLPVAPSGATNVAAGMEQAKNLMGSDYSYTGKNTDRQKVVIVFTDGVPTTDRAFETTVATNAIASAKNLKDAGATVYTIGIFSGADPKQLYGEKADYGLYPDIPCTGEIGSVWGGNFLSDLFGGDIRNDDIPAGNRFLNYLSSNFALASEIGIKYGSYNPGNYWGGSIDGYKITATFPRTASTYYLTANDSTSLNAMFKTISNNIQAANIDLGSETKIKDTVSPYFDAPADASGIRLYTAAAKANGSFEADVPASGITATIENNAVTVTGFDFNANFVSKEDKGNGDYGKKLIIEFTVTPKAGFIGGNDVPTNDWQNTGVYDKNGAEVEKFANATTTPTVNVPIKTPEFTANNKTIYEGNSTDVSGLYTLPDTTGWQYDYVKVTAGANDITDETVSHTDCTDYTVKVTYAPKTDGESSAGTANAMAGVSKGLPVTVHVLKPTVTATVNDVQKYYGESYTLGDGANGQISVEWTDKTAGHTDIPAAEGTAPYTVTDLHLAYSTEAFTGQGGTVPKHDFDVAVKVMKGAEEIGDAVITTTCSIADSSCTSTENDGKYTVHVKTCQLTITKNGGNANEPYVFTVFKDNEKYSEVTVMGNSSVTIYELPVGTYTIVEDTGWSWRYPNPTYSPTDGVALSAESDSGTITCTNSLSKPYWLNGFSTVVQNIFGVPKSN